MVHRIVTDWGSVLVQKVIFDPEVSAKELLQLESWIAAFWALFFYVFAVIVRPLIKGKSWLVAAGNRDYERGGNDFHEALGMSVSKEDFLQIFQHTWPWMQAVSVQHFVGGSLWIPAIFNLGFLDPNTRSSLACLAILSEMGWEVEDMIGWL